MKNSHANRFSPNEVADAIANHLRDHGEEVSKIADHETSSTIGTRAIAYREKKALWPRKKISNQRSDGSSNNATQES